MIELDHVSKWYGPHAAVRDLDLHIERGSLVGLLGLNGAGKTTTLRMIVGLLDPTHGSVRIDGDECAKARAKIGFVPDRAPLYDDMRVDAYLGFVGRLRKLDRVEQRVDAVRAQCDLDDVIDAPIHTLSHGYRQRVAIAQALLHEPAVLVLDEPNQGLDPLQIVEMQQLVGGLRGDHTVVVSTHILGQVRGLCDEIVVIHEGRVAARGTSEQLGAQLDGRPLRVVFRGDAAAVDAALREVGEVADDSDHEPDAHARIVRADGDVRAEVARIVVEHGELLALEPARDPLERVFARLVEDT